MLDLLLDQTFVAGIGNKYKSEILFLSKINPFVTIKDIPSNVMKTLLQQIPSVLRIGYMNAGMTRVAHKTLGDMAKSNNKKYSDRHRVFRRGGRPCWKCMTQIVTDYKSSARVTFWRTKCQPPVHRDILDSPDLSSVSIYSIQHTKQVMTVMIIQ
jgi:endonuclease VIII